jgi:hypothetical protein
MLPRVGFTAKNAKNAKKVCEQFFAVFAFFAVKSTGRSFNATRVGSTGCVPRRSPRTQPPGYLQPAGCSEAVTAR